MVSWFFCICSFSLALRANDERQNVHLWILIASLPPSPCSFSCTSRLHCLLKAFPQTEQLHGFSPVCVNKCDARCTVFLNALEHMWHFALRMSLCTLMWLRNEYRLDSILPQISHCTRGPYCKWDNLLNFHNYLCDWTFYVNMRSTHTLTWIFICKARLVLFFDSTLHSIHCNGDRPVCRSQWAL